MASVSLSKTLSKGIATALSHLNVPMLVGEYLAELDLGRTH